MVLEYAEGGTLYNRIKYGFGQLQKNKIKRYFRDVCKAVEYLHSLKYMHRDIKVKIYLCSLKIYFLPKMIMLNFVISALLLSYNTEAHSVGPMSIWLQK